MKSATLLQEAVQLSISERIELAEAIWDTVAADPNGIPVPAEHRAELDRRLVDLEATPTAGSTWDEVRGRLERRQG